jgi:hypothetical protein
MKQDCKNGLRYFRYLRVPKNAFSFKGDLIM